MEFCPTSESELERYFLEISSTPILPDEQEKQLGCQIENGNPEAREQLVKAHLRLVASIAFRYTGRGVVLLNLIEEGTRGLFLAVEAFDPSGKEDFGSLANRLIEQEIQRAFSNTSHSVPKK